MGFKKTKMRVEKEKMMEFKKIASRVEVVLNTTTEKSITEDWLDRLIALGSLFSSHFIGEDIRIYAYESETIGGLRINEISLIKGNGGSSWMRGESSNSLFSSCEDFLETYGVVPFKPEGWKSYINEHGEARISVLEALGIASTKEYDEQMQYEDSLDLTNTS